MRDNIKQKINNAPTTQVDLSGMGVEDGEIQEIIAEIIKTRPMIDSLFLDKNKISDNGALNLAAQLTTSQLENLALIDLQFNRIDKKGMVSLFALKSQYKELKLNLHGNVLADVGQVQKMEETAAPKNKR